MALLHCNAWLVLLQSWPGFVGIVSGRGCRLSASGVASYLFSRWLTFCCISVDPFCVILCLACQFLLRVLLIRRTRLGLIFSYSGKLRSHAVKLQFPQYWRSQFKGCRVRWSDSRRQCHATQLFLDNFWCSSSQDVKFSSPGVLWWKSVLFVAPFTFKSRFPTSPTTFPRKIARINVCH